MVSFKDRYSNKPGTHWLRTVRLADLEARKSLICVRFMSRELRWPFVKEMARKRKKAEQGNDKEYTPDWTFPAKDT